MDEVVTAAESDLEHFIVSHTGVGIGYHILGAD